MVHDDIILWCVLWQALYLPTKLACPNSSPSYLFFMQCCNRSTGWFYTCIKYSWSIESTAFLQQTWEKCHNYLTILSSIKNLYKYNAWFNLLDLHPNWKTISSEILVKEQTSMSLSAYSTFDHMGYNTTRCLIIK